MTSGEGNDPPLSILAWRIPWTEEPGGLQWGHKELVATEELKHRHSQGGLYSLTSAGSVCLL